MRLPHRLQGQKVKSQCHGAGACCGGDLAAQLVSTANVAAGPLVVVAGAVVVVTVIRGEHLAILVAECSGGSRSWPWGPRPVGGLGPSLFVQAPQFFHRLLIIVPPIGTRGPGPQSVWLEPRLVECITDVLPQYPDT